MLEQDPAGLHRVKPEHVQALRAVIGAFDGADTKSRLLLTSRFLFTLPDGGRELGNRLLQVHVPPMTEVERRKQAHAKERALDEGQVDPQRSNRCIAAARGNPGLQNLLFISALRAPAACDTALAAMERYHSSGEAPAEEELREFLEGMAIDALLGLLTAGEAQLLRRSCCFSLPVPLQVLHGLGHALGTGDTGAQSTRLLALGLWDRYSDPADPSRDAAWPNPLVVPRLQALTKGEHDETVRLTVQPLFQAWGGASSQRIWVLDLELTRLALQAEMAEVLKHTAAQAVQLHVNTQAFRQAKELGTKAIAVLDAQGIEVPRGLLRVTGEACHRLGDVKEAAELYGRALKIIPGDADLEESAALIIAHARLLHENGEVDVALREFERVRDMLSGPQLRRSRAVTLGDIARIRLSKGQVDEALRLHQERLAVFEELEDPDGIANTKWSLARIELRQERFQEAFDHLSAAYEINLRLGRLDGICIVGLDLGQLLMAGGHQVEARIVLERSRDGFAKLGEGWESQMAFAQQLLDKL